MIDKISKDLGKKFDKTVIINEEIDESIIGGIILKIGDMVIDGSIAKDLIKIKEKLINSKVRSELAYED